MFDDPTPVFDPTLPVRITKHAIARFNEHWPEAGFDDMRAATAAGAEIQEKHRPVLRGGMWQRNDVFVLAPL